MTTEPDLVGFSFILNDLHKILHQFKLVNGEIVGQKYSFSSEARQQVQSPLYKLLAKSHFLVWLRGKLAVFDDLIELYAGDQFSFELRPDFGSAWEEAPWRDVEAQLARARELGQQRGFRVFVVVFPFAEQLRPDYLARDADFVRFPQRKLYELCTRLGIPLRLVRRPRRGAGLRRRPHPRLRRGSPRRGRRARRATFPGSITGVSPSPWRVRCRARRASGSRGRSSRPMVRGWGSSPNGTPRSKGRAGGRRAGVGG